MTQPRDRGSGSVLVVGAVAVLLVVGSAALVLVGVVRATHEARSAADLAALAGAQRLATGSSSMQACAGAARIAAGNGARLSRCVADEGSGEVVVEVTVEQTTSAAGAPADGPRVWGPATGRARAGPGPPP